MKTNGRYTATYKYFTRETANVELEIKRNVHRAEMASECQLADLLSSGGREYKIMYTRMRANALVIK